MIDLQTFSIITLVIVVLCWFAFAAVFLFRKKTAQPVDRKRDRGSIIGLVIQGVSYAIVWSIRRTPFTPLVGASKPFEMLIGVLAMVAAIGSVLLAMAAVASLGKEWSVTARVVEGHKLAIEGPYAFVRHPIYASMLGMLVATGLAISHWLALLTAVVIFFVGTVIRIQREEKLLRENFGSEFDAYANAVAALVPGIF